MKKLIFVVLFLATNSVYATHGYPVLLMKDYVKYNKKVNKVFEMSPMDLRYYGIQATLRTGNLNNPYLKELRKRFKANNKKFTTYMTKGTWIKK